MLGVAVPPDEVVQILGRLEIEAESSSRDGRPGVAVVQPSFRPDLLEEVDAIEEIARQYGYDRVDAGALPPLRVPAQRTPSERLQQRLRSALAAGGYREVVCSSFMEAKDPDRLGLPPDDPRRRTVQVRNPLVSGEGHLRTTALPEMPWSRSRSARLAEARSP